MAKKNYQKNRKDLSENDKSKLKAFVASFFTIIGFLIAIIIWREDKYVMYYAKHGLILFIGQLIVGAFSSSPFFRGFSSLLLILWAILWILTWYHATSGKEKDIFIVSDLAKKINL